MTLTLPTGPLWGDYNQSQANMSVFENAFNHKFLLYTFEMQIDKFNSFSGGFLDTARAEQSVVCVGVNPYFLDANGNKQAYRNSDVAAGVYDAKLNSWRDKIVAYSNLGGIVFAIYHLEPNVASPSQPSAGTATDFKNAFARVYSIWHGAGIQVGWDMTAGDWNNNVAPTWEPANYDVFCFDAYAGQSGTDTNVHHKLDAPLAGAATRGKPVVVRSIAPEFADAPNAQWITDAFNQLNAASVYGIAWDLSGMSLDPNPDSRPLTKAAFISLAANWPGSLGQNPPPAPTITSFSPTHAQVGNAVVINGTSFLNASSVKFGGVAASSYTINSATKITAIVPANAVTGTISVTTPSGTATSSGTFTVDVTPPPPPLPTITGFNPTSGQEGASVVITGTNFITVSAVSFGGVVSPSFTVNSDTQLVAVVPVGAITGLIRVTTSAGMAVSSGTFTVTVVVPPPPTPTTFEAPAGELAEVGFGYFLFSGVIGSSLIINISGAIDTTTIICEYTPSFTFIVPDPAIQIITTPIPLSITAHYGLGGIPVVYQGIRITGRYDVISVSAPYTPKIQKTATYLPQLYISPTYAGLRVTSTYIPQVARGGEYQPVLNENCIYEPITLTIVYEPEFEEAGTV